MIWYIILLVGVGLILAAYKEGLTILGVLLVICGFIGVGISNEDSTSKLVEDKHRLKKEIAEKMKKRNAWKWHQHLIKENQQLKDSLEKL